MSGVWRNGDMIEVTEDLKPQPIDAAIEIPTPCPTEIASQLRVDLSNVDDGLESGLSSLVSSRCPSLAPSPGTSVHLPPGPDPEPTAASSGGRRNQASGLGA